MISIKPNWQHYFQWLGNRCQYFRWVVFGFGLLLLTCHSDRQSSLNGSIVLTYWSANNQYEINLAQTIVAEWNQQHPGIQVQHQSIPEGQSSEEVILAAVVSKTTPDIYSNIWPGDVGFYAGANALVPLGQFADFDSTVKSRLTPIVLAEARAIDGHVYQLPWKTNPIMVIYNRKFLRDAGFAHFPQTYSEYLRAAAKITTDLNGDGYIDRWMGMTDIRVTWWQRFFDFYSLYIAASNGKTLLNQRQVIFDNPAAIQVFEFLQTLFRAGYFPKEKMSGRTDIFLQGIIASRFTGSWDITHVEKFKSPDFEYDFAPLPRPDSAQGPVYTYGDLKNIVIFNTTKHRQAAWEFVKYLISRQSDLKLLKITNQLPLRKALTQDSLFQDYFQKNPRMVTFAKQAQYVRGADSSPVLKEIFDAISQEFEACVVYGVKSPPQAVQAAAARTRLILE